MIEAAEAPQYKKGAKARTIWNSYSPPWPRTLQLYMWQYPHSYSPLFTLTAPLYRGIYHGRYYMELIMKTATLFTNGRSQAVRLPKECRFSGREVFVRKYEDIVILFPKRSPWAPLLASLSKFSDDFMSDRAQPGQTERKSL